MNPPLGGIEVLDSTRIRAAPPVTVSAPPPASASTAIIHQAGYTPEEIAALRGRGALI